MSWNYRIMEHRDTEDNHWFDIRKVYYEDDCVRF